MRPNLARRIYRVCQFSPRFLRRKVFLSPASLFYDTRTYTSFIPDTRSETRRQPRTRTNTFTLSRDRRTAPATPATCRPPSRRLSARKADRVTSWLVGEPNCTSLPTTGGRGDEERKKPVTGRSELRSFFARTFCTSERSAASSSPFRCLNVCSAKQIAIAISFYKKKEIKNM